MKIVCATLLSFMTAAMSAQPAIAQPAQSGDKAPVRLSGAVPYQFPGQWVLLGDATGQQDNIIAYFYDVSQTQRAGTIVATVWIAIDEKNVDAIRTNLYSSEFDCSTKRVRSLRVQNYDSAHYPVVTAAEDNGDWQTPQPGSTVAVIATMLCSRVSQTGGTVTNVQDAALRVFRARREISAFAVQWGPYAILADLGWWRRADGSYWHYSWIIPGQELRAEWYSAGGQRAWNLRYRIQNGALTSDQSAPQPIRFLSPTVIEHGQHDRIALIDNGSRMSYRSGDQQDTYDAAPPPSFAQSDKPGPSVQPSTDVPSAPRQASAAASPRAAGYQRTIAASVARNPVQLQHQYKPVPGKLVTYEAVSEGCVTRITIHVPEYSWEGQQYPARTDLQVFDWTRGGRAQLSPTSAYYLNYLGPAVESGNRLFNDDTPARVLELRDAINGLIEICATPSSLAEAQPPTTQAQSAAADTRQPPQRSDVSATRQIWIESSMVELDRTYIPTFWYQTSLTGRTGDRYRIAWSGTRLDIDYDYDRMTGTYPDGQSIDDYAGSVVLTFKADGVLPLGLGQPSDTATFTRYRVTITKIN